MNTWQHMKNYLINLGVKSRSSLILPINKDNFALIPQNNPISIPTHNPFMSLGWIDMEHMSIETFEKKSKDLTSLQRAEVLAHLFSKKITYFFTKSSHEKFDVLIKQGIDGTFKSRDRFLFELFLNDYHDFEYKALTLQILNQTNLDLVIQEKLIQAEKNPDDFGLIDKLLIHNFDEITQHLSQSIFFLKWVEAKNKALIPPLIRALLAYNYKSAGLLVQLGTDPNVCLISASSRQSALHLLLWEKEKNQGNPHWGGSPLFEQLLEAGANPFLSMAPFSTHTAHDFAENKGDPWALDMEMAAKRQEDLAVLNLLRDIPLNPTLNPKKRL